MRATLTIDLGAIKHNYHYLQSLANIKVGAAIKSDCYGLGANQITPALFEAGCRDFFVAHFEEGILVRSYLPSPEANIYVMHGIEAGEEKIFAEYGLVPSLSNLSHIKIWNDFNPRAKSIIHIDTGMNRLGMSIDDFITLSALPQGVEYLISHLACDGDIKNQYNQLQLDRFIKATEAYKGKIKRSLAASGGIFLGPEYHFDMVRPGAALYGIGSSKNPNIKNPVSLTANIIHINHCKEDSYIGYGSTAHVKAGSILATIPIGYADGLFRFWGNRGSVLVNGKKAPIMGTLSMDLSVIDVTGLNGKLGDEVEIIGPHNLPDQIGAEAGTIDYEILTSLKCGRFNRVFNV